MSFKCKECGEEFEAQRGLHTHVKKHSMFLGDYYVKHYARKNKLTGDLLPFKNYKDYFSKDFSQPHQLMEWVNKSPAEEVREYLIEILKKRVSNKDMGYGPTELELRSAALPSIEVYKEYFGSYTYACDKAGVMPLLGSKLPKEFFNDYSDVKILIDTREQQPLSFKNSESFKLDVGDYGVTAKDYDYTYVDRKSFGDFCGTTTVGYARFCKELDRCRSLGAYLFVVMEFSFEGMDECNYKSYKKYKLDYVLHNMREIQKQYKDCCQFVFAGSRELSEELIPKLLVCGKQSWKTDINYFWSKHLKES
jgi:hypothetical protein